MKDMCNKTILFVLLLLAVTNNAMAGSPSAPDQPSNGPGGSDYQHKEVLHTGPYWVNDKQTKESDKYFIFKPAAPMPEEAPVFLFIHGWGAIAPTTYQAYIDHIVKKGYIVVWTQYQRNELHEAPILTFPWLYTKKIIIMWKDALKRLDEDGSPIRPARNEQGNIKTAIVGHSAGGLLAVVVAAKSQIKRKEMPKPYAVMAVEPGALGIFAFGPFWNIDPDTKIIFVVGDEDNILCRSGAVRLWRLTSQIPTGNKQFLLVKSDYHGKPEQIANHYFPGTSGARDTAAVDARDFYITFKLTVGLLNCAFKNTDCEYALANGGHEQLYMGEWSDGQPITPMVLVHDPESLTTTCHDPGLKGIFE